MGSGPRRGGCGASRATNRVGSAVCNRVVDGGRANEEDRVATLAVVLVHPAGACRALAWGGSFATAAGVACVA